MVLTTESTLKGIRRSWGGSARCFQALSEWPLLDSDSDDDGLWGVSLLPCARGIMTVTGASAWLGGSLDNLEPLSILT